MLTDAKVRAAKLKSKAYKLGDSNRLFLLVNPGGGKLWRWNYYYDGKQKSLALGAYPIVSLIDARRKRDEARTVLENGRDLAIAKKLKTEALLEAARCTVEKSPASGTK